MNHNPYVDMCLTMAEHLVSETLAGREMKNLKGFQELIYLARNPPRQSQGVSPDDLYWSQIPAKLRT